MNLGRERTETLESVQPLAHGYRMTASYVLPTWPPTERAHVHN